MGGADKGAEEDDRGIAGDGGVTFRRAMGMYRFKEPGTATFSVESGLSPAGMVDSWEVGGGDLATSELEPPVLENHVFASTG